MYVFVSAFVYVFVSVFFVFLSVLHQCLFGKIHCRNADQLKSLGELTVNVRLWVHKYFAGKNCNWNAVKYKYKKTQIHIHLNTSKIQKWFAGTTIGQCSEEI